MSRSTFANPMPFPPDATGVAVEHEPRPRSYAQQVLVDTFAGWRARIGVGWIGVLLVVSVLAPFLANSHPLLLKVDGKWSSPLLRYLTPVDVILLGSAVAVMVAAAIFRSGVLRRWPALLATIAAIGVVAFLFVRPPETAVYDQYRQMVRDGRVERIVHVPIAYSPTDRQRDVANPSNLPPSQQHWFGTEVNGSDVLSRMIYASRIALSIGFISTGIAVVIGCIIGGIMGYFAGKVDIIGMRFIEIFEAIPTLFLLITFVAFFGRNLYIMMAIIGVTSWSGDARFIRAEFLRLRKQDFVQAAIAAGLPLRSVLFRHMLPNGIAPVLVSASFGVASAILAETTLSFLGLGLVDAPSWGQLLEQARSSGGTFIWWIAIFPGMAIFLTVFAYNMVGEALRDAIDPHLRKQA